MYEDGWTWVSAYPWGWAPFHYGRWLYDETYGPMWVPDNHWDPGRVTWRRSSGYYGWTPKCPGISISIAYGNNYNPPHDHWRFVRENDFGRTNITNYYVNTTNNFTIIKNTTVINNVHENKIRQVSFNAGPDRVEVEKHTGRSISPVAIKENNKPGERFEKNELQLYRPNVVKRTSITSGPAPSRVSSLKELKPVRQKGEGSKPEKATQPQKQPQKEKIQPVSHPPKSINQPKKYQGPKKKSNSSHDTKPEGPK